jgi:cytoskeletal protein RodZ
MTDLAEFGRYLKQQRELRGLSREELARTTRISPGLIVALEEGQSEKLPEQVFVQNYVRSYAKAVGLPENEVLNRLLAVPGVLPPTEQSPVLLESSRRSQAFRGLVVSGVLLLAGALALWWWKAAG